MAGRLVDYMGSGLASALPAAATVHAALTTGAAGFYYATDTSILYSLNRSGTPAWEVVGSWKLVGSGQTATGIWDHAVDGTKSAVNFTDLDDLSDLMVLVRNVTLSGNGIRAVRVSVDNGASFYATSGNYEFILKDGTTANSSSISIHDTSSNLARSGTAEILGVNLTTPAKVWKTPTRYDFPGGIFTASPLPINAVTVIDIIAGYNLTGGGIYLFGR